MDAVELVKRSPELVGRHDKAGWLELFTETAVVEDPVGAGAYVGKARLSRFWDVFIAPHRVTFLPDRDFAGEDRVVRKVTISTVTAVSPEPLLVPAIIEYRVEGARIAALRAFWKPLGAVTWYGGRGLKGVSGLMKHGARMTLGLGVGSALGFSRALVEDLSEAEARRHLEPLGPIDAVVTAGREVAAILDDRAVIGRVEGDRLLHTTLSAVER